MSTNESHGSRIALVRLRAIVSAQLGTCEGEPSEFGQAVGVVISDVAWVLLTGRHERGLGPALIWALRNKAKSLKLFSEAKSGDLARCAKNFKFSIEVFEVDGPTTAKLSVPKAVKNIEVSVADEMFAGFISSSGAEVTREHGIISGEVAGLEVCRVVHDETDGLQESRLEIGVGVHDRETFQMLHGRTATIESLRKVVDEVAARRAVGAPVHPLNQLARERILRHAVCQSPQLIGAESLIAVQPPMPRANVKDLVPCCATGVSKTGQKIVAVFSIGIDPDVVTFGADAREQINSNAELVFVSPTRDIVPAVTSLAEMLSRPAKFVGVDVLGASARPQV